MQFLGDESTGSVQSLTAEAHIIKMSLQTSLRRPTTRSIGTSTVRNKRTRATWINHWKTTLRKAMKMIRLAIPC